MPSPMLKGVSARQKNTQTDFLGVWEEGGTVDGGGKLTQERMADADGAKATEKRSKNCQMQTKTRLTKKDSQKNHALLLNFIFPF